MTEALLLAGFVLVIAAWGILATLRLCGFRDGCSVIGSGVALGLAADVVLTNALGYVLPIRTALVAVPAVLLLTAIPMLLFGTGKAWSKTRWPSRRVMIPLWIVVLFAAAAFARDWSSDYGSMLHLPLPILILEGNFPIRDVTNPWMPLAYHYGSNLFAAQTMLLTGLSATAAYAVQPLLAVLSIVFCAAGLGKRFGDTDRAAFMAGLLALLGGGLFWLYGVFLARDLFTHELLGQALPENASPWAWLTHAIRNIYAGPLLTMIGHRPIAMGSAFLFAFLSFVPGITTLRGSAKWASFTAAFLCGAGLALTMETSLALLFAAVGVWSVVLLFRPKMRSIVPVLWLLCIVILFAALHQGGILSVHSGDVGGQSFAFGFDGRVHYDGGPQKDTIALWHLRFWRDFGPHALLLIASGVWLLRKKMFCSMAGLIWFLAAAHVAAPLFVRFLPRENEMNRLFFTGFSLTAIPAAMWLSDLWKNGRTRKYIVTAVFLLTLAGVLHLPVRLLFPTLRIEASPLLPPMPPMSALEEEGYAWVRDNTTLADGFFINDDSSPAGNWERIRFMTYAKRFAISGNYAQTMPETNEKLRLIHDDCNIYVMKELGIRYMFIAQPDRAEWFASTCDGEQWETKFAPEGRDLPRIFGLR